jgi:hypothetical protein
MNYDGIHTNQSIKKNSLGAVHKLGKHKKGMEGVGFNVMPVHKG